MLVVVALMLGVAVPVMQVVHMVTMGNGFVAALWAVNMIVLGVLYVFCRGHTLSIIVDRFSS